MRIGYCFFADQVVQRPQGRIDVDGVHSGAVVSVLPHLVRTTLVLLVECEPHELDIDRQLTPRVWCEVSEARVEFAVTPRVQDVRLCSSGLSPERGYHYVPVPLEFMATRPGAYHIEIYRDDELWETAVYRVQLGQEK